mmetsp:Transcript_18159/g.31871  ORF Transcript_18159/g.31871 Transcript_18159/m.31871 type:complete len:116 (+) Transcript_18159:450-797(+)
MVHAVIAEAKIDLEAIFIRAWKPKSYCRTSIFAKKSCAAQVFKPVSIGGNRIIFLTPSIKSAALQLFRETPVRQYDSIHVRHVFNGIVDIVPKMAPFLVTNLPPSCEEEGFTEII